MPFKKFIFRDGMAVLFSSAVIFHLGYEFAEHYDTIIKQAHRFQNYFLLFFFVAISFLLIYIKLKKAKH